MSLDHSTHGKINVLNILSDGLSTLLETELKDSQTLRTTHSSPGFQMQQRPAANKLRFLAKNMNQFIEILI